MSASPATPFALPDAEDGLPTPRRYIAAAAVLAAIVLAVLDGAIANVALPTIATTLHVTPAASVWVVTGYQMALVVSLLPCAALGESYGYRRIFTGGVVVFTAASALCALSPALPMLVAARFLQGLGAAAIMSLIAALLRFTYPQRLLGTAIGLNALVVALSSATGPTLGAAILSLASWPWLFAVNIPIGIIVLCAATALPQTPAHHRPLDLVSVAFNAGFFAPLVVGVDLLTSRPALGAVLLAVAALSLVALVRREAPRPAPLIPLDLLRGGTFRYSVVASVCCFAAQMLAYVALPVLSATRARAGRLDDRSLHDAVAADGCLGGTDVGPALQHGPDRLPLRRRRALPRDRPHGGGALAPASGPRAAHRLHDGQRARLRFLSDTQQPQHAAVGPARAERSGRRHAGDGAPIRANHGCRHHGAVVYGRADQCTTDRARRGGRLGGSWRDRQPASRRALKQHASFIVSAMSPQHRVTRQRHASDHDGYGQGGAGRGPPRGRKSRFPLVRIVEHRLSTRHHGGDQGILLPELVTEIRRDMHGAESQDDLMTKQNPHIGSTFESWLDETGIREEVTTSAVKAVIAAQITEEMKKQHITKARMAEMMQTSRAQLDRLLDPDNGSATLESLMRAARVVGRELRLELV